MVKETIQNTQKENKLDITKIMLAIPKAHSVGIGPISKIRSKSDNIVVIGYCFGGTGVLEQQEPV
jgi:hypothetical protein